MEHIFVSGEFHFSPSSIFVVNRLFRIVLLIVFSI
jgi:hypothetical protein